MGPLYTSSSDLRAGGIRFFWVTARATGFTAVVSLEPLGGAAAARTLVRISVGVSGVISAVILAPLVGPAVVGAHVRASEGASGFNRTRKLAPLVMDDGILGGTPVSCGGGAGAAKVAGDRATWFLSCTFRYPFAAIFLACFAATISITVSTTSAGHADMGVPARGMHSHL